MERSDGFHIDLDDFLTGLLLLVNELVSFTSRSRENLVNHNGMFSICNHYSKVNITKMIKIEKMILFVHRIHAHL